MAQRRVPLAWCLIVATSWSIGACAMGADLGPSALSHDGGLGDEVDPPDSAVGATQDADVLSTHDAPMLPPPDASRDVMFTVDTKRPSEAGTRDADSSPPLEASIGCGPVINEVELYGPDGSADEYVELYNTCPSAQKLAGWKLVYRSSAGSVDILLADLSAMTIGANGYLLFTGTTYKRTAPSDGTFGGSTGMLSGTAGGIGLRNGTTLVDSLGYGSGVTNVFVESAGASLPLSGQSMSRLPNGTDSDKNSIDFKSHAPTPGAKNE